tara:strand:+ start:1186 stop:1335 length:150 start_codon:yes stop_codon:yes gene_type:complete
MASRLDGEKEQREHLNKRYIPGSKGGNPFRTPLPKAHKKLKSEQKGYNV